MERKCFEGTDKWNKFKKHTGEIENKKLKIYKLI